ncbi:FAD/NAD(P)-binding protein [Falsiroseomonas sp. HW251]|uniref:FAD/NAD(P)-binding protein n=1 Tax=Falsiroseomonas sp. HW251 TaxID=3390998 RepID=UPI003D323F78
MHPQSIAVIGAGFSGTLLALHLLRKCPPGTRVTLLERNRSFGRGQAYATGNAGHLLNVPAGRMSAFRDRPDDFLDWLRLRAASDATIAEPAAGAFVSRGLYGDYVRHLLNAEIARPHERHRLDLVRGDVVGLAETPEGLRLSLDRGRAVVADLVVLAIGNFPPELPPGIDPAALGSLWYRPDPWAPEALGGLDPDATVLLLGTGLTTVDAVVSLLDAGHRGPIHALSRRGLLPHAHAPGVPVPPPAGALPTSLSALTRLVRKEARRRVAQGLPWQPLIDSLRPFTQDLWQAMAPAEKARFLRHLRPWWDVHRHRMAGPVAVRIEAARAAGQFVVQAGRIRDVADRGDTVELTFRARRDGAIRTLRAARLVNCAGPGCDYDRIADPLVRGLLDSGLGRADPLRLGLDVTATCALRDRNGAISRRLFAIGPVTKAAFWEMTAAPDIRRQCETLADHIAGVLAALPARDAA